MVGEEVRSGFAMDTETPQPAIEPEWVYIACPSCQKKIKLPADRARNTKFKCPSCSQVVKLASPERADLPEEPEDLISQQNPAVEEESDLDARQNFLENLKTSDEGLRVEDPEVESQMVEKDGAMVVKRRRRVKKRRKKGGDDPDWEADGGSDLTDDEKKRDGDDEEWSYAVDVEVTEDGEVIEHRRRIKKKKHTTLYESITSKVPAAFLVFGIAAGLVLGGAAHLSDGHAAR